MIVTPESRETKLKMLAFLYNSNDNKFEMGTNVVHFTANLYICHTALNRK